MLKIEKETRSAFGRREGPLSAEEKIRLLRRLAMRIGEMAQNLEEGRKLSAFWGASATREDWEAFGFGVQAISAVKSSLLRSGVFLGAASESWREREKREERGEVSSAQAKGTGEGDLPAQQASVSSKSPLSALPTLPDGVVVRGEDGD